MNIRKSALQASLDRCAPDAFKFQLHIPGLKFVISPCASMAAAMLAGLLVMPAVSSAVQPGLEPAVGPAIGPGAGHRPRSAGSEAWARGRILVMPRAGLPAHEFGRMLGEHGGKARKVGQSNLYVVDLPAEASEEAVAARLAGHPHFKFAELDRLVHPDLTPNDPYYLNAWHLPKIGAPSAWDSSQGSGVTIAILDSGVDSTHPDLAARMVPGWNFYNNNPNTADVYGHGTMVAGTAAAASNNGIGVTSVAGQSKIMPVRVADTNGSAYLSMITQGLTYAADNGARVANLSFGGVAGSASVQSASQYMKNKGGLVVVAAGNAGTDEGYAATTTMIPVSATDGNDMKTSWSSYGKYVAMSAPGIGIYTTSMGSGYSAPSGTSFSSPITAGVVALIMATNTALSNTQVENLLYSTAVDLGDMGRDPYYGYGRVDAGKAVSAALSTRSTISSIDVQAPSVSITSPHDGDNESGLVPVNVSATDNVGVTRVELRVNNTTVAVDNTAPFAFSWDSKGVPDGAARLVTYAFDAAGNFSASSAVTVNVSNGTVTALKDTIPPTVQIINPVAGIVSGTNVTISVSASDNSGPAGITQMLYIDGVLTATGKGSTLGYNWNTRKAGMGRHSIQALAKDAAGNTSSASVAVTVAK